jgi:hypothetical protein
MLWIQKKDATARPAHRAHVVQAAGRIEDEVPGGQLDVVHAVGVLDRQLAAVVLVGRAQEQRGRQVRAHAMGRARHLADGVVDVDAEGLPFE